MMMQRLAKARDQVIEDFWSHCTQPGFGTVARLVLPDGTTVCRRITLASEGLFNWRRLQADARAVCAVGATVVLPSQLRPEKHGLQGSNRCSNSLMIIEIGPQGARAYMNVVRSGHKSDMILPLQVSFPCADKIFNGQFWKVGA